VDYEEITSADMAEQALSQAVDDHIENSKEVIDKIEALEAGIRTWNTEDIRELKGMIAEMRELLQKHFQVHIDNFMNMKKIPSQKVPEVLKQVYKIIGIDKRGYALYGNEMDKIAHIKKIAEHYQQRAAAGRQDQPARK
jgi:hypothetical protein